MTHGLTLDPRSCHAPLPTANAVILLPDAAAAAADDDDDDVAMYCICADDVDLADELSSRSWEQQRQKIKAIEDKYRWKLNEHGVRIFAIHCAQFTHECRQQLLANKTIQKLFLN